MSAGPSQVHLLHMTQRQLLLAALLPPSSSFLPLLLLLPPLPLQPRSAVAAVQEPGAGGWQAGKGRGKRSAASQSGAWGEAVAYRPIPREAGDPVEGSGEERKGRGAAEEVREMDARR